MAGVKRKLEEFDVSKVACKECNKAIVHGGVTELSPIISHADAYSYPGL